VFRIPLLTASCQVMLSFLYPQLSLHLFHFDRQIQRKLALLMCNSFSVTQTLSYVTVGCQASTMV